MNLSWKAIRHRFELAGVRFLIALPLLLPFKWSVKLGGILGILAFDVFRIRRGVTLLNLQRAFDASTEKGERIRIGRRSYVNFAKSMVEFASLGRLKRETLEGLVRVTGIEHLDRCLRRGSGAVAVTGHFGSWELLGAAVAARNYPVDFLVGEQSNRLVDDVMNALRRAAGISVISKGIAARGVFKSLRRNRLVALLSDQDARKAGVFVDFFGEPASTFLGAAQFAYRMKCPLLSCFIIRRGDETHDAHFLPPIEANPENSRHEELLRLTAEHTKALEDYVTRYPDHYFWAHRRWKTRPAARELG